MIWRVALALLAAVVVAAALWVRLAPSDVARWHRPPPSLRPGRGDNWVIALWPGDAATLARLARVIEATPRTRRLAGSVEEGRITWVTRSALWGFPDYTSVEVTPEGLVLWARARFGRSDLEVNARRLARWRAALEAES